MSFSSATNRKTREKVYGPARGVPLDRNAKARIMAFVKGYNAKERLARQHRGPITRAFLEVLEALLWGFHNSRDGRCFPSYEAIAEKADCHRDTVYEAIRALERANILTWCNRFTKLREKGRDLFGRVTYEWKIYRLSNAYVFRDPLPCAPVCSAYKSENPAGTLNPESISKSQPPKIIVLDPKNDLDSALIRLGRTMGALPSPG